MAMMLTPQQYWSIASCRLRQLPGSGFPGETAGRLRDAGTWKPVEHATMAYGYGLR